MATLIGTLKIPQTKPQSSYYAYPLIYVICPLVHKYPKLGTLIYCVDQEPLYVTYVMSTV
jgi:hypothetical protein